MKYECQVCSHIHDEEVDGKFEDLPMFYLCPSCGCHKDEFVPLEKE
jgi:rubredoxin